MSAPVYIETAVEVMLKASPEVTAICAGRVFPLKIPQGAILPAVIYQRIHTGPDYTFQGYTSEDVTLMINCFAIKYERAKALALAVRKAMATAPLDAIFKSERDLMNETGDVFCVSAEYLCQQNGGYCYHG